MKHCNGNRLKDGSSGTTALKTNVDSIGRKPPYSLKLFLQPPQSLPTIVFAVIADFLEHLLELGSVLARHFVFELLQQFVSRGHAADGGLKGDEVANVLNEFVVAVGSQQVRSRRS